MRYLKLCILGLIKIIIFNSCTNNLDLYPQDQINNEQYWSNPSDLTYYVNQFYTIFPVNSGYFTSQFWADINSDDMVPGTFNNNLGGLNTISTNNGNWAFGSVRSVNYGLENYHRIDAPFDAIKSGVGELNFFKSYIYFNLLKRYGDVPWLSKTINIDSEELYNIRTDRSEVVDSILKHLDLAIEYLPVKSQAGANRLNKECALLFKSRVALYEGSWHKYHSNSVFAPKSNQANKYYQLAVDASETLINMNTMKIHKPVDPYNYFGELFGNTDYSSNTEILLWKKHDANLGMAHNIQGVLYQGGDRGLSKALVESFLCKDGLPISVSPLYKGDATLMDVVADRDPRLSQSFWVPGVPFAYSNGVVTTYFNLPWIERTGETRNTTGYQLVKGRTVNRELGMGDQETASIIFRYAEALLNFAEAKAELGQFTQLDADKSINVLRSRVQMPNLYINAISADPNWMYQDISPLLNEIRRERRVELACEGYRYDDLQRWAAIKYLVNTRPRGFKFRQTDFPNLVIGTNIYIDSEGYLDPYQKSLPNGYKFNLHRDYLLPVPMLERTLNPNLSQNPGWEEN